jgi:hypothetical protein
MSWWLPIFLLMQMMQGPISLLAQDPEMKLIERVAELQHQLESPQVAERDEAEKELLSLGTLVLDHLEPPTSKTPSDAIERTSRIRRELEKIAVASVTKSSTVTLNGNVSVDQALAEIRKQTTNDVALSAEIPDVFAEKKIDLDLQDVEFWTALAQVMKLGSLVVDPYAGEPGQLRLAPTQAARVAAANPGLDLGNGADEPSDQKSPHAISGVFDLTVTKINASRNLVNPAMNYCNITILVRWEPRVQPVSVDLPIASITAIDEFDKPISVDNEEAILSGLVQPEIPELEFSIPIGLVDRQIEVIKSLDATIDAVLPGRIETFRFRKIGGLDSGTEQRKAGAIVTYDGFRKNDDLYGVTVRLSFEEDHNALESHQGWAFNNPAFLEDSEGKKFQPVALETIHQDNQQIAIQFYFIDDPKDMTLVYKTAAAIVRVPVKIHLTDIPLP